ncbi:hypothetical protein I4U23_010654 [Adineta vaga]|nr:hypothetical protein I4U23_010654 [Adineta vaga]
MARRGIIIKNYANLYGLGLFNLEKEKAKHLFAELHANVKFFSDCLYLLDGRLPQLRIFHVNISVIHLSAHETISKTENLPNLECFSLYCNQDSSAYDELVIPLLYRMLNSK